jgi:hypothetical protein
VDELKVFASEVKRKLTDLTFAGKRRVVDLLDTRVVLNVGAERVRQLREPLS